MVSMLDRKLLRDLWRMRSQALAVALVAMAGIATFVTMRGSYEALLTSQAAYYEKYRFADIFVNVKRAPLSLAERVRAIPGIGEVDTRVVFDASLDVPGLDEPASARLVSLPEWPDTGLNRVHIRSGRAPLPGAGDEALASEAFSQANRLKPGDTLQAVINGRKEALRIVGIAISPEYVSEIKGNSFPDNRRFGVLWMGRDALAAASNMRDGFNDLAATISPAASEQRIIEQLDAMLAPYGTLGAYGRKEQISHNFLDNELSQDRVTSTVLPAIFLAVAAFLIHNVLSRFTALQRAQIGLVKSFGYEDSAVAWHYLKFALVTVLAGGIAGIAVGTVLGKGLARMYANFFHFPDLRFSLSASSIFMAAAIAAASAAVGSAISVRKALSLPPAEAMRPEQPGRFKPGPLERLGLQRIMALPVRMVLRNLERRPMRTLLSITGMALAVALVVTGQFSFDALNEIIRLQFRVSQRDDATVVFNEVRDQSVADSLASLPGVLRVETFRNLPVRLVSGHRSKKTVIMGLGRERQLRMILDEAERKLELPPEGIVLNAKLAELLGARVGFPLAVEVLEGRRQVLSVPVTRIVDEPIGAFAYMDSGALARLLSEPESASGAFLSVDSAYQAALYRTLKTIPAIGNVSLREATLQSFLATVAENMRINTTVLLAFACIIAFGVVYNSARIALSEHAVELASLRILGFTREEVGAMLLGEQALLTLTAIPLGCAIGYGFAALLSALLSQELFRIPLVVSSKTFLLSACAVLVAAAVSGYLVWRKVRRLDLIEVLKTRE
ncbi:MAG TPA: ABC transporter permease [Burkholderiaceae bacterium]